MRYVVLILASCAAFGQATPKPAFEVASVKPSPPVPPTGGVYFGPARGGPGTSDPGQITWTYARMRDLIMTAYDAKTYQVIGPAWMDMERYDIIAKVPPGAAPQQVNAMWRNLLAERFGLTLHQESKEFPVWELMIAKGGSKLKSTAQDPAVPLPPGPPQLKNGELLTPGLVLTIFPGANATARVHAVARAQTVAALAARLGGQLKRPTLDKTGLTGQYDFTIDYTLSINLPGLPQAPPSLNAPAANNDASDPGPDFAAALEQQLGLRLVASKAKIDLFVIDQASKVPTEN